MYADFIRSIQEKRPDNIKFENSERHHIIPKCLGGTNEESNLIYLTLEEHFIAHRMLVEENPGNLKLASAFWRMCNSGKVCTPEDYAKAREVFVANLKESYKGEGNPFYGKHVTPEHAAKMSAGLSRALRGKPHSPEHTENFRKAMMGKTKGKPKPPGFGEKISKANKGRVVTQETRDKIAAAQRGVKRGPRKNPLKYHCKCKVCGEEFMGNSPSHSICEKCVEEKNKGEK